MTDFTNDDIKMLILTYSLLINIYINIFIINKNFPLRNIKRSHGQIVLEFDIMRSYP